MQAFFDAFGGLALALLGAGLAAALCAIGSVYLFAPTNKKWCRKPGSNRYDLLAKRSPAEAGRLKIR